VIEAYPDVDSWVIGGHSLGGAMTAEYLKKRPDAVDGLVFLASYPSDSTDLSAIPAKVVSIYGTEDGVTGDVFEESLRRLPAATTLEVIEGGNHAQFGHYGPQKGDGTASVSREEQQRLTTNAILKLVGEFQ
jgi:pimeloyl-ACP methyl ester carboxylesterase